MPWRKFINLSKADWSKFQAESEPRFEAAPRPSTAEEGERLLRSVIADVSKRCIPGGRHKWRKPALPVEAKRLIRERDTLRQRDPTSPQLHALNAEITEVISSDKRDKWHEHIATFDHHTNVSRLWRTVKDIDGRSAPPVNCAIDFVGKVLSMPKKIAAGFNKLFTSPRPHTSDGRMRKLIRRIRSRNFDLDNPILFTDDLVSKAIKKAKCSKASGPDSITNLHLKALGPHGVRYLTEVFNLSIRSARIPAIWKLSTIVPLGKPGKDATLAPSYRPISLLCPAVKILEALILPYITEHLAPVSHQHGFRPKHSTTSALLQVSTAIATGFNQKRPPHRTIAVALDLTKAFDMVDHFTLLSRIEQSSIPINVLRWLSCYLRGRQAKTSFRDALSPARIIRCGVPQGSVISPALFNFYINDLPAPPADVKVISYADDISIMSTGPRINELEDRINPYLGDVAQFLTARKLVISTAKSTVSLFTPHNKEYHHHPNILINGTQLPLEARPKILGVTFDTAFTFAPHCQGIASRVRKKNCILRALTGTSWGQQKETLVATYKALGRSLINYAAPVWTPVASNASFGQLQRAQNGALRTATGCVAMTGVDHLHQETSVLPVKDHSVLLSAQYLASCRDSSHPCHQLTLEDPPPRTMKKTLNMHLKPLVDRASTLNEPGASTVSIQKTIHSQVVDHALGSYAVNPVIDRRPPDINPEEKSLPRAVRSKLSQLRSGYSSMLHSYQNRLNSGIANSCPDCDQSPHDTVHLFNCPANPVQVNVEGLWLNPVQSAAELKLVPPTASQQ
jgi:hypothetical protein